MQERLDLRTKVAVTNAMKRGIFDLATLVVWPTPLLSADRHNTLVAVRLPTSPAHRHALGVGESGRPLVGEPPRSCAPIGDGLAQKGLHFAEPIA
jgi:hypothetical protein